VILGFRAGADPAINVEAEDFTATKRAFGIPAETAAIGRVFPSQPFVNAQTPPAALVTRLDKAAKPVLEAKMWPYLSFKPDVADTLAGRMAAHFTAVGRWIAGLGVPVYLSVWHEPENDPMGAAPDNLLQRAKNFVRVHIVAYAAIHDRAANARVGPCHLVHLWKSGSPETANGRVAEAWRVPAGYRDFVAADSYTSNWSALTVGTTLRAKKDFQRWKKTLIVPGGNIILGERGISRTLPGAGPAGQAAILANDIVYLTEIGAQALMYWNSVGAVDNSEFRLGAAGRQVLADAANPPPPAPPPAPAPTG
jgi:hypothetical protein